MFRYNQYPATTATTGWRDSRPHKRHSGQYPNLLILERCQPTSDHWPVIRASAVQLWGNRSPTAASSRGNSSLAVASRWKICRNSKPRPAIYLGTSFRSASTIQIMPNVSAPQYISNSRRTRCRSTSGTSPKCTRKNSRLAVPPS